MTNLDEQLEDIERLVQSARPAEAEERAKAVVDSLGDKELRVWEPDLRRTFARFLPKRRRSLMGELDRRLGLQATIVLGTDEPEERFDLDSFEERLRSTLGDLSKFHIFQWSTFYRDVLSPLFDEAVHGLVSSAQDTVVTCLHRCVSEHSHEIFKKGYEYQLGQPGGSLGLAVNKSLGGLARFLELPVEFYSARTGASKAYAQSKAIRRLAAAMLGGILEGYSSVQFGPHTGADLLAKYPKAWAHYLGFLCEPQLAALIDVLPASTLTDALSSRVLPLLAAIDELGASYRESPPLPTLGQLAWEDRRLDVSIRRPASLDEDLSIEVQCFLNVAGPDQALLQEALNRQAGLVVAPLRPDVREWVASHPQMPDVLVDVGSETRPAVVKKRIRDVLQLAIYRRSSPRVASSPLTHNFAREFPLHNQFLTKYFRVYRSSVRDLLRTFERRNGVRLWCSVRRSGKTTACFDLGSTTGGSVVVSQTCDSTEPQPDANTLYELVSSAIEARSLISKSFLRDAVLQCAPPRAPDVGRFVLVLDEYETLFGRLRFAADRDPELRYTVVQPLLSQMVAFSRDNLLVFMGQQPSAHYIMMEQNQLSAYVEQDPFPLFAHRTGSQSGEFIELLSRVLTGRVEFDVGFADAVFEETSGHPFLTVKLLVALVDWVIGKQRALRDLRLARADFDEFAREQLGPRDIALSVEYDFFREAVSQAVSPAGLRSAPWLFAIYSALRELAHSGANNFELSVSDCIELVARTGAPHLAGVTAEQVVSSGTQANFFTVSEGIVRPRILLLARIAAVSHRAINT